MRLNLIWQQTAVNNVIVICINMHNSSHKLLVILYVRIYLNKELLIIYVSYCAC